ncbi:MAG: GNAT family N-acetyltransferase [Fimbriimonadaceae bacterium]
MIQTERLALRNLTFDDAPFIYELLNDPAWLEHIGDRGVKNLDDARAYIQNGPMKMLADTGFALQVVELEGVAIGLCGLLKRDYLECPDIGFAFLPKYRGQGYAFEAALGVCRYAGETLNLPKILAICSPANGASANLLINLGFVNVGTLSLPDYGESLLWERSLHDTL